MKRHMIERLWSWFAFEQGNGDVVVADGDAIFELKFFAQSQGTLKPAGAFFWIAHRQAEVTADAENKRGFHSAKVSNSEGRTGGAVSRSLIPVLYQQPYQAGEDPGESRENHRSSLGMAPFELRNRDIIMDPAGLKHHHQKKRDNETNRTPLYPPYVGIDHF